MPIYEYECTRCQKSFEVSAKMSDPAPKVGPGCGQVDCCLEKKFSAVAAIGFSAAPKLQSVPAPAPKPMAHKCGGGHCGH